MLSIGNFSKIAKVRTKTLRYYDEIGLLRPAYVDSDSGYRYYDVAQLEEMLLIQRLKQYRFSLDEIAQVLRDPSDNKKILSMVRSKKADIETQMQTYQTVLKQLKQDIQTLERGKNIMSYLDQIEVKLEESKPMNLLFMRQHMKVQDYGKYVGMLYQKALSEKLTIQGPPMSIFHGEEFDPEHYDMEVAFPVAEPVAGTREFPQRLCAHATLRGPYTELSSVYAKLREWAEKEEYILAGAPFELYMTDPSKTPPDENVTEIYMPVKK